MPFLVRSNLASPFGRPIAEPVPFRSAAFPYKCLELDGAGYASHADDPALNIGVGDATLSAWIRTHAITKQPIIFKSGAGGYYDFHINAATGFLECKINDGANTATITGDVKVNDNQWHHVFCALDKSSATGGRLYVDGVEDESARTDLSSVDDIDNDGIFYIGYDGTVYFVGKTALANLWNMGYGGLPTGAGNTPADYAAWRYANPYADLSAFNSGGWSGYADANRTEVISNGGFEDDADGTSPPTGWQNIGTPTVNETDDAQVHSGTKSNKITADALTEGCKQSNLPIVAGKTYEIVAWAYGDGVKKWTIKGYGTLHSNLSLTTNTVIPATWTRYSLIFTASYSENIIIQFYSGTDNSNGTAWWDDISLKQVGEVATYPFNGSYLDESIDHVAGANALGLTEGGSGNRFVPSTV